MSAIGGISFFDGRSVDIRALIGLGEALAMRGPDGGRERALGPTGMAYRAFHTNRESRRETQPLATSRGHLLAWDGRLDNREDLIAALPGSFVRDRTDAAIVMMAFLKWGGSFLTRLVGDFALSLWDPDSRELLLARDAFGTRPLFYHLTPERILWSSELEPLLYAKGVNLEIDDEYIADYLVYEVGLDQTPYREIRAVPPGHSLIVREGRPRLRRFWSLDPRSEIRCRDDREYEECFRQLFRDSIKCRLRADAPVWSELSGGLDSSSIVCVADQLIESGDARSPGLTTVSYIYDESSTSNEGSFIRCVEEQRREVGTHLYEKEIGLAAPDANDSLYSVPSGLLCFSRLYDRLNREMRRTGSRVLLNGRGGDHLLWSDPGVAPELADLLARFDLSGLHRRIRAWSRAQKTAYLTLLWKSAVKPLLPSYLSERLQPEQALPPWIDPEFARRLNLGRRSREEEDVFGFDLPSGRSRAVQLLGAIRSIGAHNLRSVGCTEVSYPFLHRPLVEFLMAIPIDQLLRPGETRSLHRRALKALLPEKIVNRQGKKGPDEAFYRGVAREWPKLRPIISEARVCARGYMDQRALREAFDRARCGIEIHSYALLRTLSLEFWLRSLEGGGSKLKKAVDDGTMRVRATTV